MHEPSTTEHTDRAMCVLHFSCMTRVTHCAVRDFKSALPGPIIFREPEVQNLFDIRAWSARSLRNHVEMIPSGSRNLRSGPTGRKYWLNGTSLPRSAHTS